MPVTKRTTIEARIRYYRGSIRDTKRQLIELTGPLRGDLRKRLRNQQTALDKWESALTVIRRARGW